jgi:hypothetical protein
MIRQPQIAHLRQPSNEDCSTLGLRPLSRFFEGKKESSFIVAQMERGEILDGLRVWTAEPRITLRSIRATPACRGDPRARAGHQSGRAARALGRRRAGAAICCGRFPPHSQQRFVRSTESPVIQRLLAFPQRALARDLTAGPRCGSNSLGQPRVRARRKPA